MSKNIQNNQSAFINVNTYIITKISEHWGHSFKPDKVNDYVVSLGKFDTKTLENAMTFLRENCEDCPKLATIIKVCKEHKIITHVHGESPSEWLKKRKEEEELKMQRARTKSREYTEQKIFQIRNQIEEWDENKKRDLFEFIAQSADLQAQFIEKISNPGYMSLAIFGEDINVERRSWWLKMCYEAKDDINVIIPWKWFGVMPAITERVDL